MNSGNSWDSQLETIPSTKGLVHRALGLVSPGVLPPFTHSLPSVTPVQNQALLVKLRLSLASTRGGSNGLLTVTELHAECHCRGLNTGGKRTKLIERLIAHIG